MSDTNKTLHELYLELGEILAGDSSLGDAEVFLPDPRQPDGHAVIPLQGARVEHRRFCEVRESGIRRSIGEPSIYLRSHRNIDPEAS